MRAFSIRQPYAEQIAAGELVVEGRKWCPPLGPVLVVASKTKDGSGSALPSGCAICTVEIIAVTGKEGAYEWHLMNPRRVHPFRVKEFLEIFMVPVPDAEIRFVDNSMHGSGTNPSIEPSDQASPPELQPPITPATTPTAPQNRHSRSLDIDLALSSNGVERGAIYTLPDPDQCPEPPAAYAHQLETLRRLEQCPDANPPIGGIVHLPTGAGKTRIALEYVARTLREEPKHRFIWATESKLLIQQTMSKAAELSKLFPCGTKMAWYEGGPTLLRDDTVHMLFLTRQHLHRALARARDARTTHPWKKRILAGAPVTLIYDECHQLGGPGLQRELKRFCDTLLTPAKEMHRWRFVGLSATPIPTRLEAHKLLQEDIFPLRKESKSVEPGWAMHVFHRIDNATLVRDGVLCRVNLHKDESGVFDIPSELLRNIAKETHVSPPGANASREEVVKYAMRFNRSVMSHERILQFMADRLASNFESNGKTIVFVPDIEAANRLVAKLNGFPALRGKVASVHSRMGELAFAVPDQAGRTPSEVLEQFKNQGSAPCILVNVEMLTEGFDDPKVQTVVLAKLTLSTNRFWQMIGRGTRGIRSGGTAYCSVIDPVKLVRLYDYFSGYQPSVLSGRAAIDDDLELNGLGALDPSVPAISRAPLPSKCEYKISDELRNLYGEVARAIDAFLAGGKLSEQDAVNIANHTSIKSADGEVELLPIATSDSSTTGSMLLEETLARMRKAMNADLAWIERQMPDDVSGAILRFWIRKLRAIETLELRSEIDYANAEMDGRLSAMLAQQAGAVAPVALPTHPISTPRPVATSAPPSTPTVFAPSVMAIDVARLCMDVAASDGEVVPAEVEVATRVVVHFGGDAETEELHNFIHTLATSKVGRPLAIKRLLGLQLAARKYLIRGLADVALADDRIHRGEVELISKISRALDVPVDYFLELFVDVSRDFELEIFDSGEAIASPRSPHL